MLSERKNADWLLSQFFFFQHLALFLYHFSSTLTMKTSEGAVTGNDTMTRDIWGEGIALEGLPYCLGTSTSDTTCKFAVGDGFTTRHAEKFQIDTALKVSDVGVSEYFLTNLRDVRHYFWRQRYTLFLIPQIK